MGRKVEMKKIEDMTKRQVTYSKRRSSLMKKAHEISICCDVDAAIIAFSPSGRLTKFSTQNRIEDVLQSYIDLPIDNRYSHIKNLEEKKEKLKQLHHIKDDPKKLIHLNNRIEQIRLQITKARLDLHVVESSLREFEPGEEHKPTIVQLLWCERNLKDSLKRVVNKKKLLIANSQSSVEQSSKTQMIYQAGMNQMQGGTSTLLKNINGKEQISCDNHLLLQLDPWISPYSARVRESILQNMSKQSKPTYNTALQEMQGNETPSKIQQHPAQAFENHGITQCNKENDEPINIQTNSDIPMKENWISCADHNPYDESAFMRSSIPHNFSITTPLLYELPPFVTANGHYWNAVEQQGSALGQEEHPVQETKKGSILPENTSFEAVTGNSNKVWAAAATDEGGTSWGWADQQGFDWPDNINFEDFDIEF